MTYQDEKYRRINEDLDETQGLMAKNISDMTNNIARADEIEGQTNDMMNHAQDFRKASTNLKRTMWWKNAKMWLIMGGAAAIILVIIILIIIISSAGGEEEKPQE